jgi:hypothetical protein
MIKRKGCGRECGVRPRGKLSSQIDRHRRTAVHFEPDLGYASPPMRAAALTPRRQIDTRHTTVSAGEATAEVWMLLSNRMSVRVQMGRKGILGMGDALTAARDRVPAAHSVSRRLVLEGGVAMAASDWGMCRDCQWWQIDPGANIANTTMGVCIEDALQPFRLRVSGNSGCTHYTPGEPTHAAGSSAAPPTAAPQR